MSNPLTRFAETVRSYWTGPFQSRDPTLASALGYSPTATGVDVSAWTALNFSAVWAAISTVSADVASLPLVLYKREGETGKRRFLSSKLYELLHDAPNPEMSSMVFREALQAHVMSWGNAYAEIERDGAGRPKYFWPLTPDRVTPFRSRGEVYYRVTNTSRPEDTIPMADMLHIPGLGFDGLSGYSVIQKARESIGLGLATERFGGTFFGNGSTFGGVLSHPQNLTKEVKQGIRESIDAVHSGVERAHKFVILGGGMKYDKLGIPPNDAQFLETRKFQVTEIARWFLIPPHKLGDLERATFSNIEQQDIEYYKSGLRRWLVRWEQEFNRKCIAPLERRQQFVEHNIEGLLRGDSQARAEYYSKMFNIGAYSINMILEKENMNPIGSEGDTHYVPVNMSPADKVAALVDAQIAAKQQQPNPFQGRQVDPSLEARDAALDSELRTLMTEMVRNSAALQASVTAERDAVSQAERDRYAAEGEALRAEGARLQQELLDVQLALELARADAFEARAARDAAEAEAAATIAEQTTATEAVARAAHILVEETEAQAATKVADAAQQVAEAEASARALVAEQAIAAEVLAVERDQSRVAEAAARDAQRVAELATDASVTGLTQEREAREAAERRADTAAAAAAVVQAQHVERLAGMVAAHRALIVDAMGRMVRRETEKARRHQATPEKLRAWAESFYVTHEEICLEALRPAIRAHLAWTQSADDVDTVTLTLVREHIAESLTYLRAVADGEPDEFPGALERLLQRWEQHRSEALADRILKDEVEYVRAAALQ